MLTDTPYTTSSRNPRLSGEEDEKGEAEVVTAVFSSALALKGTVYSKSLRPVSFLFPSWII